MNTFDRSMSGADPGFPLEGTPTCGFAKFSENCMKLRTFWAVGGSAPGSPLRIATVCAFGPGMHIEGRSNELPSIRCLFFCKFQFF